MVNFNAIKLYYYYIGILFKEPYNNNSKHSDVIKDQCNILFLTTKLLTLAIVNYN